jgi:prevent-host-death family protein
VSARQANHEFSELLSRVERGEEILITKRSKPVALLSPYRPPRLIPILRLSDRLLPSRVARWT